MSWRDNPVIIWHDEDRARVQIGVTAGRRAIQIAYGDDILEGVVTAPVSLAERVEATERWLAAMGLTADNIREAPRPIEAGDIVYDADGRVATVKHIDDDVAFLRDRRGNPSWASIAGLVHADDTEPDPEPGWITTRDPDVLAAARVAGRTVEMFLGDGWEPTGLAADQFRARAGERMGVDYRYEGPAIEVSPEPEWIVTRDPAVLAAAIDAERNVQWDMNGTWKWNNHGAKTFRQWGDQQLSTDYRYEGPAIEAGGGDDR